METLKRKAALLVTMIIMVGMVTGCMQPRQGDEVDAALNGTTEKMQVATFYVTGEIKAIGHTSKVSKVWKLPSEKVFSYTACLEDRKTKRKVIGHEFEIINSENGKIQKIKTNERGCLIWQESVAFNFNADATYISVNRYVRGHGVHKGQQILRMAINPWAPYRGSKVREFIDLSTSALPKAQTVEAAQGTLALEGVDAKGNFIYDHNIWTDDVGMMITSGRELKDGVELVVDMTFTPKLNHTNILGEESAYTLKQGAFKVYFSLLSKVSKGGTDHRTILAQSVPVESTFFHASKYRQQIKLKLKKYPTEGSFEAVVRIVPSEGKIEVNGFEGLFQLGQYDRLIGFNKGSLQAEMNNLQNKDFNIEMILDQAEKADLATEDSGVRALRPFEFGIMNIRMMTFMTGETATKRALRYKIKTKVSKTLNGKTARYKKFLVKLESGKILEKRTDNDGYLIWTDIISHKYYQPETLLPKKYEVIDPDSQSSYKLTAYLNPWDYGWTFGQDARELEEEVIEDIKNSEKIPSKLFVDSYRYETIRFRYEVDDALRLKIKKTVLLRVDPRVLRYSSLTRGRNALEYLRDGIYLLKVAIQKNYYDGTTSGVVIKPSKENPKMSKIEAGVSNKQIEFVTAVKKLVRVQYGKIITPIEFTMTDLRLMRIRTNFLIQIETVNEDLLDLGKDMSISDLAEDKINAILKDLSIDHVGTPKDPAYIGAKKTNATLSEIKVNKELDLEALVEKDSGLDTRTFIGPLVFLNNSFSAGLRPTDDLTETVCNVIDCNSLAQNDSIPKSDIDPELAKYYGSYKQFSNMSVSDLINRMNAIEQKDKKEISFQSIFGNYLNTYRLDYVSMSDKKLKIVKDFDAKKGVGYCDSDDINDCTVETTKGTTSYKTLIKWLNFSGKEYLNVVSPSADNYKIPSDTSSKVRSRWITKDGVKKSDVKDFLQNGKLTDKMAQRLCYTWVYYMMGEKVNISEKLKDMTGTWAMLSGNYLPHEQHLLYSACRERAVKNQLNVFSIARHLRVEELGEYQFKGGKSMNFSVGANFGLSYGESLSRSFSVDPLGWLKSIGSSVIDTLTGVFSVGTSASTSNGYSEGSSVSSGTFLAMQEVKVDMNIKKYERCVSIRMKQEFLSDIHFMTGYFKDLDDKTKADMATRGMMICQGDIEKSEEVVTEKYYYFTQHFTQGDMLDNGDLLNHPWLLALRGERDYANFVNLLKNPFNGELEYEKVNSDLFGFNKYKYAVDGTTDWYYDRSDLMDSSERAKNTDLAALPLDHLIYAYNQVIPSYPGIYTVAPKRLDFPL